MGMEKTRKREEKHQLPRKNLNGFGIVANAGMVYCLYILNPAPTTLATTTDAQTAGVSSIRFGLLLEYGEIHSLVNIQTSLT
jgi:hypothetical protein